ncbi:MAG: mechanosensitive ion channel [Bacilli bacterium]|nr:mechanosensitive ion channel [Bacilli bacterium]
MIEFQGMKLDLKLIILPIINITIGIVVYLIIKNILKKVLEKKQLKGTQLQRINTAKILIRNIIKYIIIFLVLLSILSVFGVNIGSILAGLGIGTAIIGLAFQDFAKDIIAGFSIIAENLYEVGDIIEVDGFMGEVTSFGLRTTRIKNFKGATKMISNHYMDNIINYSNSNSLAVVDVAIAYETKEEEIEKAFEKISKELNGKIPFAKKDIEFWGVNDLSDSSVVYRIVVETESMKNFAAERFLRKEIKKIFDQEGIKIPYQQIEVHNGK